MAVNTYQENVLSSILQFPFEEIKVFDFEKKSFEGGVEDSKALKALQLIVKDEVTDQEKLELYNWGVWEGGVKVFRDILEHPAPQNRPADEHGFLQGSEEQAGLLGLTVKNDSTADNITKDDVVSFIKDEANKRIAILQEAGIEPEQIEHRELTPDELQEVQQLSGPPTDDQEVDEIPLREIRRAPIVPVEGFESRLRREQFNRGISIVERISREQNQESESIIDEALANSNLGRDVRPQFIDPFLFTEHFNRQRALINQDADENNLGEEQSPPSNDQNLVLNEAVSRNVIESSQDSLQEQEYATEIDNNSHARRIRQEEESSRGNTPPSGRNI